MLTERALKPRSHTSVAQLRDDILAYVAGHNDNPKPFQWTKTADEILDKLRRFGHAHAARARIMSGLSIEIMDPGH